MTRKLILTATVSLFALNMAAASELWVGSYFGDAIKRFDLSNGNSLGTVGAGRLDGPLGLTRGADGRIYACSELTGSIEKFDDSGNWVSRFSTATSPTGLAFDSAGNAYVTQFDVDSVRKISTGGADLGDFVTSGSGGLNGPDLGVAFGPDGNLYVPSFYSGDVLRYNGTTGAFMDKFIAAGQGGMGQPRQILWRNGLVYVSSDNGNQVLRYNGLTGAYVDTFVTSGSGGLSGATGMAFTNGSLYVVSWRNNRILKYDENTGAFQGVFASTGLNGPVSLLVVPEPLTAFSLAAGVAALIAKRKR